jgi:hypothetical protein
MSGTPQRRIGRPTKPPVRTAKRIKLGLVVSAEIKRQLDKAAKDSGLSQSQEAERRIGMSYNYERVLGEHQAALAKLGQMRLGETEKVLRDLGWQQIFDLRWGGHVWLPPGRLEVQKTGWVDPNDHTPLAPPRLIPDPQFVEAITQAIAQPIIAAIKAELGQGRKS